MDRGGTGAATLGIAASAGAGLRDGTTGTLHRVAAGGAPVMLQGAAAMVAHRLATLTWEHPVVRGTPAMRAATGDTLPDMAEVKTITITRPCTC